MLASNYSSLKGYVANLTLLCHPEVQIWHGSRNEGTHTERNTEVVLLVTTKIVIINSVRALPQQCSVVSVKLEGSFKFDATK